MKTFLDFRIDVPGGKSGEIDTTCPECSAQRKKKSARCLSVNIDKGVWNCAHCGWTGSLEQGADRSKQLHWRQPRYRKPEPMNITELPIQAVKWFASRGIDQQTLIRYQIGCGSVYMPQVEGHVNAVSFPYFRGDELVNVKYRDGKKNFRMEAGCERILYGLNDVAETVVIVEGEMDKLSMATAGFSNCVSVPDGAPAANTKDYSSKFEFLESAEQLIAGVKEWIIAVDADEPGKRLEDELARRLGREKCSRVKWPDGCKDANDVLRKHGRDALMEAVEHAKPFPIAGVFEVLDLSDRIDQLYEHGWERGKSTGWYGLDKFYTVRPGEFTVVTGIPNSGKSNFMDSLCVNLAKQHGWRFAMFSPENQPLEDHMARMIEKWAGMPFNEGPSMRMDAESMDAGKKWTADKFFWILPDDDKDWTVDCVLEAAKALVFRKGISGLVIDPWNELEHLRPQSMSETEYISQVLKRVRQFARRHHVHVWFVAHPAKLYKDKDGKYPVPTMYDISGSANWRNKADNGLCIWRDFVDAHDTVEIHVQKIRFRQIGKVGMCDLNYRHATGTYADIRQNSYAARGAQ